MTGRRLRSIGAWPTLYAVFVTIFSVVLLIRILSGIRSVQDAVEAALIFALLVLVISITGTLGVWYRKQRLRRVRNRYPVARIWLAGTQFHAIFLVVAGASVILITRDGKRVIGAWERDQIRRIKIENVTFAFPRRPGLRIEIGKHQRHESIVILFPTWFGLWSSARIAHEVREYLLSSDSDPDPRVVRG